MQRTHGMIAVVLIGAAMLAGCSSDDNNEGNPPPPSLGAVQIDRMGRSGVNTALTNPFFREGVIAPFPSNSDWGRAYE